MSESVVNLPDQVRKAEGKTIILPPPKNSHLRLQKALDIVLNYIMESAGDGQRDDETLDQEDELFDCFSKRASKSDCLIRLPPPDLSS